MPAFNTPSSAAGKPKGLSGKPKGPSGKSKALSKKVLRMAKARALPDRPVAVNTGEGKVWEKALEGANSQDADVSARILL